MKKTLLSIMLMTSIFSKAQIVLEHAYDSASSVVEVEPDSLISNNSLLFIIHFEAAGELYVKINKWGDKVQLYNLDHTFLREFSIDFLTKSEYGQYYYFMYMSDHLFNLDDKIEFMYTGYFTGGWHTWVCNEAGEILLDEPGGPVVQSTIPAMQYPIYNTSAGTKLIISYPEKVAKVFGLEGTLTEVQENFNNSLINQIQSSLINAYPNPGNN